MIIETTHWTQLRLNCNDNKTFTESQYEAISFLSFHLEPASRLLIQKLLSQGCKVVDLFATIIINNIINNKSVITISTTAIISVISQSLTWV